MVRRLTLTWPDARPFRARDGRPIRWLAVSDDPDPALGHAGNRTDLGPLDAIVGCGDLEPDYLGFLADAFAVPLCFVRGNHDHGGRWDETVARAAPRPLATGRLHRVTGLPVAALEWPGLRHGDRRRHDPSAWADALGVAGRREVGRVAGGGGPLVVVSHAPPRGIGDRAVDRYHVGYAGYRWLVDRWHPPLWLHGHVPPASVDGWRVEHERTEVVNVTGAVLVEIRAPGGEGKATTATTSAA
ncbi:MAG: metallophosphoesterase [Candidatus Limnocylindrales bacterium]